MAIETQKNANEQRENENNAMVEANQHEIELRRRQLKDKLDNLRTEESSYESDLTN